MSFTLCENGFCWCASPLESDDIGRGDEARRLVAGGFTDRFGAIDAQGDGVLRFEYRSIPMRVHFDETKHAEPDMTIEVAYGPSPDRMACDVYRVIMPWWEDPWSADDRAEFWLRTESILESLPDDAHDLERLTAAAHRAVTEFLDSIPTPYLVDDAGIYELPWESAQITLEVHRNPGETYLTVSKRWGREGFVTGVTGQHLPVSFDHEELVDSMGSVARFGSAQRDMVRRWFE